MSTPNARRWAALFFALLTGIQSLFAVLEYVRIPAEPGSGLLFGFSAGRLALMSIPSGLLALSLALGLLSLRYPPWFRGGMERLAQRLESSRFAGRLTFACLLLISIFGIFDLFTTWEAVIARMRPMLRLGIGLAIQTLVFAPILVRGVPGALQSAKDWLRKGLRTHILLVFFALLLLYSGTKFLAGMLGPDVIGWNTTGTPILDIQLLLILFLMTLGVLTAGIWRKFHFPVSTNVILFILIWAGAALYWSSLPLQPSWYLASPHSPNYEFYPTSDALIYDFTSQSMLVGEELRSRGFNDITIRRPLFTFFLGLLHTIAGNDYAAVANLQSVLLAVFPALVYIVATKISGRFAGLVAAGFILLRESNAIVLSDTITIAHAKLLMSDLPTAIGVALFIGLAYPWVRDPTVRQKRRWLILGGILGALLLIRFETVLLLPTAALFALLHSRLNIKALLPGLTWIAVGAILMILPWLGRNFAKTGEIFIEVPGNRLNFISHRLLQSPPTPAAEPPKVAPRMLGQDDADRSGFERILGHYMHSNVQSVLILPTTIRLGDAAVGYTLNREADRFWTGCCDHIDYIRRLPFWQWYQWDLQIPAESIPLVAFNLFLISAGLVFAWKKLGAAGLFPIAAGQVHLFINAVARTSGGRYLLPVDWIWIVYFAIGLTAIFLWAMRLLRPLPGWRVIDPAAPPEPEKANRTHFWLTAGSLFLVGAMLPIGESLYPKIYPDEPPSAWLAEIEQRFDLEPLVNDPNGAIIHGRGIYTRYFSPDEGDPGSTLPNLYPRPFPRVVFFVAGPVASGVVLPVETLPDVRLESEEDVLVVGCRIDHPKQTYLDAYMAYFPEHDLLLVRSDLPDRLTCPPPFSLQ